LIFLFIVNKHVNITIIVILTGIIGGMIVAYVTDATSVVKATVVSSICGCLILILLIAGRKIGSLCRKFIHRRVTPQR
jgi:hypothetical protein